MAGFRNPITSADVLQPGAVKSEHLADNAVTTPKISDGAATTPKVADELTGKTITGGLIRTAVAGLRAELGTIDLAAVLRMFTGEADETAPGQVILGRISTGPVMELRSPSKGSGHTIVQLAAGEVGEPAIVHVGGFTDAVPSTAVGCQLRIFGRVADRGPSRRLFRTTSMNVAHATVTELTWSTTEQDHHAFAHSDDRILLSTLTRLTIPWAGRWTVGVTCGIDGSATGTRALELFRVRLSDGVHQQVAKAEGKPGDGGRWAATISVPTAMEKGDALRAQVFQDSGGTRVIPGDNPQRSIWATYEGDF